MSGLLSIIQILSVSYVIVKLSYVIALNLCIFKSANKGIASLKLDDHKSNKSVVVYKPQSKKILIDFINVN